MISAIKRFFQSKSETTEESSKPIIQDKNNDGTEIVKQDIKLPVGFEKKLAFVLHNVFSEKECKDLIKKSNEMGYEQALLNIGNGRQKLMTDIRNSDRCIWDSFQESEQIFNRVKAYIPPVWNKRKVMGLNERLRILRYHPGQYFKPHLDGEYERKNGERSFITMQIYLNEGFEGGETTFINWSNKIRIPVVPKTGSVLVFQHDIMHEGSLLVSGEKFTIRTDVMYSKDVLSPGEIRSLNQTTASSSSEDAMTTK